MPLLLLRNSWTREIVSIEFRICEWILFWEDFIFRHEHIFQNHSKKPIMVVLICSYCKSYKATSQKLIKIHHESCSSRPDEQRFKVLKHKSSPLKLVLGKRICEENSFSMETPTVSESLTIHCHLCSFKTESQSEFG